MSINQNNYGYILNWQHLGRVFVSIDVANLEKGVQRLQRKVDFKRLIKFFKQSSLVEIRFYSPSFSTKAHGDFLAFMRRVGYHIVSKPIKIIEGKKKANFDVEIAVDATKHLPHYDTLILFSGDSDFDYLVRELRSGGKKVLVFSTNHTISKELIVSCTKYFDIKMFQKELFK